jgi:cation:H+ antiporter
VSSLSAQLTPYLNHPLVLIALFLATSALMIWRLQAIENKGFEGTVLGTLIMPYCSGFANLVFAFVMSRTPGNGKQVLENCIVNNVTNLTLILGLAAVFAVTPPVRKKAPKTPKVAGDNHRLNKLEMLFTLIAMFLFTGTLWALGKDGVVGRYDALVLVGLFLFWQVLHVFEILKNNVRKNRTLHWSIAIDLVLIGASAYGIYICVDGLVNVISSAKGQYINAGNLGWLSGALMVLPNAFIALYYGYKGRQDIVVSSQVGDAHICIPMCIGLFALFDKIHIPGYFQLGMFIILGAAAVHFLSIALLGRLPRILGFGMLGAYALFVYQGVVS